MDRGLRPGGTHPLPPDRQAPPQHACRAEVDSDSYNPQPLIFVGYDLGAGMALDNTVRADRKHTFNITVGHGPSTGNLPAITAVKLSYSTDDLGRTPASTGDQGDFAFALVHGPSVIAGGRHVWRQCAMTPAAGAMLSFAPHTGLLGLRAVHFGDEGVVRVWSAVGG